jgi:signal transduction histidine kinase
LLILNSKLKNRIEVHKNYAKDEMVLQGREGQLHQAFLNILSNAEQAVENTGSITIFTSRKEKSLEIKIKDSGIGIKKEYLDKISDPFFTTKPPRKGTDLGLFITFDIIKDHNGFISVDSCEMKVVSLLLILF